ncbi:uncharacterized protein LOC120016692 [Tripterygium wilfordii]|uniref:uncharacterized protein LOC120016692 n=1 Tax=Tripterygium wilfordii TaxID=458696 RepID=UPI0018F7ECB2|nr:uncharacterized protein LOC120016692 [Tripterygium wilfordii]
MPLSSNDRLSSFITVFNGQDYPAWKVKMKTYLMSEGLWSIVANGYKETEDETGLDATTKRDLEITRMSNAKALSKLQNGDGPTIFPLIIRSSYAKEAWDIIAKEFEGDGKTVVIKLQNLRREFENLRMLETECAQDFYTRAIDMVNQMRTLGEDVGDQKVVQKLLISLPERYNVVVAAIEESKDLSILKPEELMGSLEAHEHRRLRRGDQNQSLESTFQAKMTLTNDTRKGK